MGDKERFYKFSRYLKERFGCRVYKLGIDAGFSCPNKDGKLSKEGCIYCDNRAFSFNTRPVRKRSLNGIALSNGARIPPRPIETQIEQGIAFGRKRYDARKFIVYFQAYTNTYASLEILRQRYDAVREFQDVVGVAIGTRPDCVNEEILDLIATYTRDYEVWLEYGLQSIHKRTLRFINRGHTYEDFLKAVRLTRKKRNIKICAHVILGLPDETKDSMLETAREIARLKLDGIKIHPLHVITGTKLEGFLKQGLYKALGLDEYVSLVTEFLEYLRPDTVIQRITADCPREFLAGPLWILDKNKVLERVEDILLKEGKFQGRLYRSRE